MSGRQVLEQTVANVANPLFEQVAGQTAMQAVLRTTLKLTSVTESDLIEQKKLLVELGYARENKYTNDEFMSQQQQDQYCGEFNEIIKNINNKISQIDAQLLDIQEGSDFSDLGVTKDDLIKKKEALECERTKVEESLPLTKLEYKTMRKHVGMIFAQDIGVIDLKISQIDAKLLSIQKSLSLGSRATEANLNKQKQDLIEKIAQLKIDLGKAEKDKSTNFLENTPEHQEEAKQKVISLKQSLSDTKEQLQSIETKLSYMRTEDAESKTRVVKKQLPGGTSLVERVIMDDRTAITKIPGTQHQASQIAAVATLSRFLPQANVVDARRDGGKVATTYVEGLVFGVSAIKRMNINSDATQHTALVALSLQMWDLHQENIGINSLQDMVLFDTDRALFEGNNFVSAYNNPQPPIGHNKLQDMDIKVTDTVLDAHIEQLGKAISSQFPGRAHGFTESEAKIIQQHLINQFADLPELQVYYDNKNSRPNQMHTEKSVDDVKEEFVKMMKLGGPKAAAFFDKLRESGIDEEKIKFLQRHPRLLHSEKLSIKQMAVLIERKNHLQGFVELRKGLQNLDTNTPLTAEVIASKRNLILKNIDHLPISTSEKSELLKKLMNPDPDPRIIQGVIIQVQLLVGGDEIKWNTLARSVYPTMAAMHAHVATQAKKPGSSLSIELSWRHPNYQKQIREPLEEELKQRKNFLEELRK